MMKSTHKHILNTERRTPGEREEAMASVYDCLAHIFGFNFLCGDTHRIAVTHSDQTTSYNEHDCPPVTSLKLIWYCGFIPSNLNVCGTHGTLHRHVEVWVFSSCVVVEAAN